MKILSQSLRSRDGAVDVALWEVIGDGAKPCAWITTSADRPDHEWRHTTFAAAQLHYAQLADARRARTPSRYEAMMKKRK